MTPFNVARARDYFNQVKIKNSLDRDFKVVSKCRCNLDNIIENTDDGYTLWHGCLSQQESLDKSPEELKLLVENMSLYRHLYSEMFSTFTEGGLEERPALINSFDWSDEAKKRIIEYSEDRNGNINSKTKDLYYWLISLVKEGNAEQRDIDSAELLLSSLLSSGWLPFERFVEDINLT